MSENTQPTPQNDEVDLGQLFKMISNIFQKLFDFIGSIFKGIFHLLILLLAHFYKRLKWYVIAGVLGVVVGYFLNQITEKEYGANMFIETNFNSGYQVYENIRNLHELAAIDQDSIKLAEILGLTVKEASNLKGFYIQPSIDENERVKMFSNYKESLDSISQLTANYNDFVAGLDNFKFKTHQIGVATVDKLIFPELNKNFAKVISENEYLKSLLEAETKNYDSLEKTLIAQEESIDELVKQYLEIRERESQREATPGSGTNLFLGDAQKNELLVDESKLVKERLVLAEKRRQAAFNKVKNKDIISVISYFPSTGYDIQKWYEKLYFIIPSLLILFTMFIFLFIGLGEFVKQYNKNNKV